MSVRARIRLFGIDRGFEAFACFGGLILGTSAVFASRSRDLFSMLITIRITTQEARRRGCITAGGSDAVDPVGRGGRHFDVSAPLALVIAGLLAGNLPFLHDIVLEPELVLYVILPPLPWSAGTESGYVALRKNLRPIGLLAVGLPLVTTFAVGFVAYKTVPEFTIAAALTLGAIVAPPDAVSATAATDHGPARRGEPAQRRDGADRL